MTASSGVVAVTGASGFLGRAFVDAAQAAGLRLLAIPRSIDVTDSTALAAATRGATAIVHLAGSIQGRPQDLVRVNVLGTLNALEVARANHATFVFASSLGARTAENPYGCSKRQAEEWCELYARLFGLNVCVVRLAALFGPGARWSSLIELARANPARVTGDGSQRRDYLHVGDAADALLAALDARGYVLSDAGTGEPIAIRELASWLARPIEYLPHATTGPSEVVANPSAIAWRPTRSSRGALRKYLEELGQSMIQTR